jgi:single-strand binding protein/primosomal replication protein n
VNLIQINGTLTSRDDVRYTPAGIQVFEGVFHHRTELTEAGRVRKLEYDFPAIAFGAVAEALNKMSLGTALNIKGFLAPRSMKSTRLIVHITEYI